MISPRELFRKNEADAKTLAIAVNEPWFQRAATYALAQMATNEVALERIAGANYFLGELERLAEDAKPSEAMPDKSNLTSYN